MTLLPAAGARPVSAPSELRRRVRGHTRLVHALRWLLPALMLGILVLLGAYVVADALRTAHERPRDTPTQIRMVNPHFLGRDDQGRAFNLTAHQAFRDDIDPQRVVLVAPVLMMDVDLPHPKTVSADKGVFDEDTRMLRLTGHVHIDDSQASTVNTAEAVIDTRAGTVNGAAPIEGAGPKGSIQARSYQASQKTGVVVFKGGVHARLSGAPSPAAAH
ncbi:MAG TPA: LPS export ABC transporter periplasmic protein LptC [Caulobacteraceae bacterium]